MTDIGVQHLEPWAQIPLWNNLTDAGKVSLGADSGLGLFFFMKKLPEYIEIMLYEHKSLLLVVRLM